MDFTPFWAESIGSKLPQFLATNVMPYVGDLVILAFVTHLADGPFGRFI